MSGVELSLAIVGLLGLIGDANAAITGVQKANQAPGEAEGVLARLKTLQNCLQSFGNSLRSRNAIAIVGSSPAPRFPDEPTFQQLGKRMKEIETDVKKIQAGLVSSSWLVRSWNKFKYLRNPEKIRAHEQTLSSHIESLQTIIATFTAENVVHLDKKIDELTSHMKRTRPRLPWKDGFNHGFHLEKVPVINQFVGREAHLAILQSSLVSTSPASELPRRRVSVLYGLGGAGKTQIAIEFARRHKSVFSSTFFLDSSSQDALLQSFLVIFRQIAAREAMEEQQPAINDEVADLTPEKIKDKVLEWFSLEGNHKWLLIFDNVDLTPEDPGGYHVESYFPPRDYGSIIITTRRTSLAALGRGISVKAFDIEQSLELLDCHITEAAIPEMIPEVASDSHSIAKKKLIDILGGLPLAISQAGRLIRSEKISVEEYIEDYEASRRKVIERLPSTISNDPDRASIRTTWTASINILKRRMGQPGGETYQCAYKLLLLFAYFEPTDYDYTILEKSLIMNNVPPWARHVFQTKSDFLTTVRILLDLSLLDRTSTNGSYSMHRVVHDWLCTYLAYETDDELLNLAATAISWSCPPIYVRQAWAEDHQRLIVHANHLRPRLAKVSHKVLPVWLRRLDSDGLRRAAELWWSGDTVPLHAAQIYQPINGISRLLSSGGMTSVGLSLIEEAIKFTADTSIEQDESYLSLLYGRASLLLDCPTRLDEADTIADQVIEGFRGLGNYHWVASTIILKGCAQAAMGIPIKAIRVWRDAIQECRHGGLGMFVAPAWSATVNISKTAKHMPQGPELQRTHLESLKMDAQAALSKSPNARRMLQWLASNYADTGDLAGSQQLLQQLLEYYKHTNNKDSLEIGRLNLDLGLLYFRLSSEESIAYFDEWFRICSMPNHHGADGSETEMAHLYLALACQMHQQYAKAETHLEAALAINEGRLSESGALATETWILSRLIEVNVAQGLHKQAEKYERLRQCSQPVAATLEQPDNVSPANTALENLLAVAGPQPRGYRDSWDTDELFEGGWVGS